MYVCKCHLRHCHSGCMIKKESFEFQPGSHVVRINSHEDGSKHISHRDAVIRGAELFWAGFIHRYVSHSHQYEIITVIWCII